MVVMGAGYQQSESDGVPTLAPGERALLLPRERLGDALIAMVLAENLRRAGVRVCVCSDLLQQLADWFPKHDLRRAREEASGSFEVVLHQTPETVRPATQEVASDRGPSIVLRGRRELRDVARVEAYRNFAARLCGLSNGTTENGMRRADVPAPTPPARVVLHPESREQRRNWPAAKFFELAGRLRGAGFVVHFVVAPDEASRWAEQVAREGHVLDADRDLARVARKLARAALFVGNDSGLGHLASSIGVPTLTLFARPALARRWRPAWSPSEVALPAFSPPGTALQFATWRRLLSVRAGRAPIGTPCTKLWS